MFLILRFLIISIFPAELRIPLFFGALTLNLLACSIVFLVVIRKKRWGMMLLIIPFLWGALKFYYQIDRSDRTVVPELVFQCPTAPEWDHTACPPEVYFNYHDGLLERKSALPKTYFTNLYGVSEENRHEIDTFLEDAEYTYFLSFERTIDCIQCHFDGSPDYLLLTPFDGRTGRPEYFFGEEVADTVFLYRIPKTPVDAID